MKFGVLLILMLLSNSIFAQSLKNKREKAEMIERVEKIIELLDETREFLGKEDVITACDKIDEIFEILPDHLVAIGTKMNIFDGKVIRMEQETKMHLIYVHQQKNIGAIEQRGENLDIKDVDRKFKSMSKALKKQKNNIKKLDTTYSNTYRYYYEF